MKILCDILHAILLALCHKVGSIATYIATVQEICEVNHLVTCYPKVFTKPVESHAVLENPHKH